MPSRSPYVARNIRRDHPQTDPFRVAAPHEKSPTLDAVVNGVMQHPELVQEIVRRLTWTDYDMIAALLKEREERFAAICRGDYGRRYAASSAGEQRHHNDSREPVPNDVDSVEV